MTVRTPNVEPVLSKIPGVTNVKMDDSGWITCAFKGTFKDLDKVEREIQNLGISACLYDPCKFVIRPSEMVKDKTAFINALKGVAGVKAVDEDGGYYHCLADPSQCDPETLLDAAKNAGAKSQLTSHEVFTFKIESKDFKGAVSALEQKLKDARYVLRATCGTDSIKVVVVKGKVSKTTVKGMIEKEGLIVVQ